MRGMEIFHLTPTTTEVPRRHVRVHRHQARRKHHCHNDRPCRTSHPLLRRRRRGLFSPREYGRSINNRSAEMTMKLCLICQMNGVALSQLIHTVENAWKNNLNSVQSWIWNIMKSQKAKHPFHHTLKLKACHFTFWPRDRNALKEGKSDRTKSERLL